MPYPYPRSVDEAVRVLDDYKPDWREDISLEILDMGSCKKCVLGQLFGSFDDGIDHLFGHVENRYCDTIFGYMTDTETWVQHIKSGK